MLVKTRKQKVTKAQDVAGIISSILAAQDIADRDKEQFYAIGLNSAGRILYVDMVGMGIVNACLGHPREIFRLAVWQAARSIIVSHNHPSGEILPSKDDDELTVKLVKAGEILGIKVLDHVIVGQDGNYLSYADCGKL